MSASPQTITADELLARFVVASCWFRTDLTVKPDAFIPYPFSDLSVTRHMRLSESELWKIGSSVAAQRNRTLYGRADVESADVMALSLSIKSAPLADNPNHANITGWPQEKSAQKSLAQQIAAKASFVSKCL